MVSIYNGEERGRLASAGALPDPLHHDILVSLSYKRRVSSYCHLISAVKSE